MPSECFVPAAPATHFQSPNALFHAPNGTLYVSDHGTRSIFAVETGRTHLISKPPSMGGESFQSNEYDQDLESPPASPSSGDKTQSRFGSNEGIAVQASSGLASPRNGEIQVQNPYGLVGLADNSLLVADMRDNTIKRIKGEKVSLFAGCGQRGSSDGRFNLASFDKPKALCITPRGDLLVTEVGSHRIRLLIMDYGGIVITVAGQGPKGYREGSAETALFSHPSGVCCSKVDEILSLLTYRPSDAVVQDDNVTLRAENEHANFEDLRQVRASQQQTQESSQATSAENNFDDLIIFVSDTNNHRVRAIYDGFAFSLAGNGERGMADGPGNLAQFNHPAQICMAHHAILVADTKNDCIRFIDLVTNLVSTVPLKVGSAVPPVLTMADASEKMSRPNAMCLNRDGELFVSVNATDSSSSAVIMCCAHFVPPPAQTKLNTNDFEAAHMSLSPNRDSEAIEARGELQLNAERTSISERQIDVAAVDVSEDVQGQMQLLQDVKRASKSSPGGHIQQLVERERSRSVDAGPFAFVSEGSYEMSQGLRLPRIEEEVGEENSNRWSPWNLWNRLTRMLSADESTLMPRDDSGLRINGRGQRDDEMRKTEAERNAKMVKESSSLSEEIRDLGIDDLPEVGGSEFKRLGTKRRANKKQQGKDSIEEPTKLESIPTFIQ